MNATQAIEALRQAIRLRHLSYSTEQSYCSWIARYCRWIVGREGDATAKVTAFLTDMARSGCSSSSQNQALQALLMFYREVVRADLGRVDALRAKRPEVIRYAPTVDEVRALLGAVRDVGGYPIRLIVQLTYGCGLRVNEPLDLRIKDVDLANSRLTIRRAKGGKDRVVALPCSLASALAAQMKIAVAVHEADKAAGIPVALPGLMDRKAPGYAFARSWAYVFPARSTCRHPRTGATVRYRCLDINVQRAVRAAAKEVGLYGQVTPHCLRHAYATHLMRSGANVRDVQEAMGHVSLETTMGYLHTSAEALRSPLDALEPAR
jgi:site-specific recombinase XerD